MIQFEEVSEEQKAMVRAVGEFISALRNRSPAEDASGAPKKSPGELLLSFKGLECDPSIGPFRPGGQGLQDLFHLSGLFPRNSVLGFRWILSLAREAF